MTAKTSKLTARAAHLLGCIGRGQVRVFYFSDRPPGWVHLERAGYAVRNPDGGTAALTDAGRAFLAGRPAAAE